ncbi:S8 family serine peptidase [Marinovum sp.]|uniref:subtilisin-like serine protease QhpE n=1 Tax=Marinovum sp. TaxID=2024839 RepID=UPI002B276537|nr:S8 family serine peptidase [Marinovum sp.]
MVRVGIIDSGPATIAHADARAFGPDGEPRQASPDRLGHGTVVAQTISRGAPGARLRHAQVFDDRPVTSALRVAAALDWFRSSGDVDLVCFSLGLAKDRAILGTAVEAAREAGLILVSAHPAQGQCPYPAAYPGVIAATGDARCGWTDISVPRPDVYGAWCNSPERGRRGMGGASLGTARITGHIAALFLAGHPREHDAICATLAERAILSGPERRTA